jgi:phage tail tape-measure protein
MNGTSVALRAAQSKSRFIETIGGNMNKNTRGNNLSTWIVAIGLATVTAMGCAGGPMTTREKGAGIGAIGGAAAGGLIGAAVGHPGAGAAIGGGVGLGAGALIGDYLQGQEQSQYQYNQQQIEQNQRTSERNRQETERLRQRQEY